MPTTFTVTNTNDSGGDSFRQAIIDSNGSGPGLNTITFAILPAGVQTISLLSALPTVTHPVVIDGTTEPGFAGTPIIVLNGSGAGGGAAGLTITAGSSTVKGFVIDNFSGDSIDLTTNGGDLVQGNYIGINAAGTAAAPNSAGILISTSASNTVGGATAATRNVISGNANDGIDLGNSALNNLIEGNYIGTNAAGTVKVANQGSGALLTGTALSETIGNTIGGTVDGGSGVNFSGSAIGNILAGNYIGTDVTGSTALGIGLDGVDLSANRTTIGGTVAGAGNDISGNGGIGVVMASGSGNVIAGNFIGTNAAGTGALGNTTGITLSAGVVNNTIGGTTVAAANVISGNFHNGVYLTGDSVTANVLEGNLIGTGATGVAVPNLVNGVILDQGAAGNTIGGTSPEGLGNVISGNGGDGINLAYAPNTTILGNRIGVNAAGTAAQDNGDDGINATTTTAPFNTGLFVSGNVISGNGNVGIDWDGVISSTIQGNLVGTDVTGTVAVGNGGNGIVLDESAGDLIGGTSATERNIVSGNVQRGIFVQSTSSGILIQGNYVGTDVSGTLPLGNGTGNSLGHSGIRIEGPNNTVGGTAAGPATSSRET